MQEIRCVTLLLFVFCSFLICSQTCVKAISGDLNENLIRKTESNFDYLRLTDDALVQSGKQYKYLLEKNERLNKREAIEVTPELSQEKDQVANLTQHEQRREFCLYENIKVKINSCFQSSNDCNVILECIATLNLVELCHNEQMNTPSVWIVNVYEILNNIGFCKIPIECDSVDNEYLTKLNDIMTSTFEYGPAFLDQPKVDNKIYCSKSHTLVTDVRELFDTLDQCFNATAFEYIMTQIEQSAESILDRDCQYCISANNYFDECEMDIFGNDFTCEASLKCIYEKIDLYKCSQDQEVTPLTVISSFMKNISSICEHHEANETDSSILVVEWFKSLNSCIKDKRFMGLTFKEAPPHADVCLEIDELSKCIHNSVHNVDIVLVKMRPQFVYFANQLNRLERECSLFSQTTTSAPLKVTRHPFQNNSEQTVLEDNKNYYHQTVIRAEIDQPINWINVDSVKFAHHTVRKDDDLSKNYLKATIVKLRFKFPFYGHLLDQIVVATGGFIYVGSLMNPLITKAQYIAPLMANFDPTLSNRTVIKYVDNSTHFICTWENLILQDQPENGEYTFQVVLNRDGGIIFNYKKIPTINISNIYHTVKIGLSDAYIYYKILSTSKIEYTIVQYHVVNVKLDNVKTGNSIMFFMLKNCLQLKSCESCLRGIGNFNCLWCPALQRCSDTMDRYRQEWIESSCPVELNSQTVNNTCLAPSRNSNSESKHIYSDTKDTQYIKSVVFGIFITILISMIVTIFAWAAYAYRNPTSPSGIWLIEHRPSRVVRILMNNMNRKPENNSSHFDNPVA